MEKNNIKVTMVKHHDLTKKDIKVVECNEFPPIGYWFMNPSKEASVQYINETLKEKGMPQTFDVAYIDSDTNDVVVLPSRMTFEDEDFCKEIDNNNNGI